MRVAKSIELDEDTERDLRALAKGRLVQARVQQRARIILLAADGLQNKDIAVAVELDRRQVALWRQRFLEGGIDALRKDAPRTGRPATVATAAMRSKIVHTTLHDEPVNATHWSTRTLAAHLGVGPTTIRRVWRSNGLKPHLVETFKLSNDKRLGTTTLFAALNTLDGSVISMCQARYRHIEWLKLLRLIDRQMPPHLSLHLIVDNYATHNHPEAKKWLAKHPRFVMHFTPTGASWLNMVERFFRDITDKRIRRDSFTSVAELELAINLYVDHHNADPKPFIWTASASDILAKVTRAKAVLAAVGR